MTSDSATDSTSNQRAHLTDVTGHERRPGPHSWNGRNVTLITALVALHTVLLLSAAQGGLDVDLADTFWTDALIWLASAVVASIGVTTVHAQIRRRRNLTPGPAVLALNKAAGLVLLCLLASGSNVWLIGKYTRSEQRVLAPLAALPDTSTFHADTEHGVFTGQVSRHDLICGTLDSLIYGDFNTLSPAFTVRNTTTAPNNAVTAPNEAVLQMDTWSARSLNAIQDVPANARHWLRFRLRCPGTAFNTQDNVHLTGTLLMKR